MLMMKKGGTKMENEETILVDDVTFEIEELKNEIYALKEKQKNLQAFVKAVAFDSVTSLEILKILLLKVLPKRWLVRKQVINGRHIRLEDYTGRQLLELFV
jgi:hypothetical protein